MKIEIIEGFHLPEARTVKDNTYYSQKAYINKGGAFPEQFLVPLAAPINAYPIGNYEIDPNSYQVNQYGSLEINRFNLKLLPIKNNTLSK